jgi:two-component system NtrC family response regulator
MANGGTIFLDEVAEMAPDIQVKLLRALESRTIRRLGGKREINVDIRVVAATNKNLQKAISEGELREDLYYRLAVVEIFLPPLRERLGDVKLLANEFLARYAQQNGKKVTGFDNDSWSWILNYRWPGNVRELENRINRAVIMTDAKSVSAADLDLQSASDVGEDVLPINLRAAREIADRKAIRQAMSRTDNKISGAAKLLGISRPTLYDLLKQYRLSA